MAFNILSILNSVNFDDILTLRRDARCHGSNRG
jgi:hypothetical protein